MNPLYRDRPDLYDLLHDDTGADLAFIGSLADALVPDGGSAIEFGCGSGRVMQTLLEQGLRVTGVDNEPAMLERARDRLVDFGSRVQLVDGDMRSVRLGEERFDLAVIAANTFMHLESHADQLACLSMLRAHLAPGAAAVIDLANPFHLIGLPQNAVTLRRHVPRGPEGGYVTVSGSLDVDPTGPYAVDHLFCDEVRPDGSLRRVVSRVSLRLVFMPELELLLSRAGLGISDAYGDYDLGPYQAGSERMIVVLRAYSDHD